METIGLTAALSAKSYPGRGIVFGKSADGTKGVIAYFIMGRSENSRNRVFEAVEDGLRTRAFDESKMVDPSLIIYAPVRVLDGDQIVTNGDQTDTVYDGIAAGKTFEDSLRTRTFEPDEPNFTPRISGIFEPKLDRYRLSILKSAGGNPDSARRYFYEYSAPVAGVGHFIHTYKNDGDPLPSFEGEPTQVVIDAGDIDGFTGSVWNALNEDNRVSLFTRFVDLNTGACETRIVNKHQ